MKIVFNGDDRLFLITLLDILHHNVHDVASFHIRIQRAGKSWMGEMHLPEKHHDFAKGIYVYILHFCKRNIYTFCFSFLQSSKLTQIFSCTSRF